MTKTDGCSCWRKLSDIAFEEGVRENNFATCHKTTRMMADTAQKLPLVYSCSGCSSAAQMANDLAVKLDRERVAEMSCIAGVGGNVKPLVETATSGRPILAIDGCPLECTRQSLEKHDVSPERHVNLAKRGVPKEYHTEYDEDHAAKLYDELVAEVERLNVTS